MVSHDANVYRCVLPYLQAVSLLCGESRSKYPWVLSGADFRFDEALDFASNSAKNQMLAAFIIVGQLDLFVIYGEWKAAAKLLNKGGDLRPCLPGFFQAVRFTYLEGLICLKAAQTSGSRMEKKKWADRAKKSMKIMKSGLEKGNLNSVHTLHLLTAELHVLNGKTKEAEESFKDAQICAKRSGFVQDMALAYELAGLHYMKTGDWYWVKNNMNLAHRAYVDWQATTKANHLQRKYPQFIVGSEDGKRGSGGGGRRGGGSSDSATEPVGTQLFVGGFSTDTGPEDIKVLFEKCGKCVVEWPDGCNRGFCFVRYPRHKDARKAIKKLNGVEIDGYQLEVYEE